jgi:hypothetical protein
VVAFLSGSNRPTVAAAVASNEPPRRGRRGLFNFPARIDFQIIVHFVQSHTPPLPPFLSIITFIFQPCG